jgi:hypothetical protein
MILLEWFTNSGKYGAHSSPTGRVRVEWTVSGPGGAGIGNNGNGDNGARTVRLWWKESGGPRVREPLPAASLGTELVRSFATLEMRGRYEPRYPAGGAEYLLEFPIIQEAERQQPPTDAGVVNGDGANDAAPLTEPIPATTAPTAPAPPVPVPVTLVPSRRRPRSRQR